MFNQTFLIIYLVVSKVIKNQKYKKIKVLHNKINKFKIETQKYPNQYLLFLSEVLLLKINKNKNN
jgi:hypothetical protein